MKYTNIHMMQLILVQCKCKFLLQKHVVVNIKLGYKIELNEDRIR